ncbi:MAG: Asp-tRNA(Asn)/Glu-tRNA(Gln) amidotransferase subunit GatC [Tissierellia bacterium]|jgi:aspartyl-tRNA(Asn)/glutamyl-tRNA(Gln) amidotransferase subunit C|nr:Asp-tRNA(Asn)/Glu-tRNA(Gln) amidotransferase subunit GatC [Tissierellia bacterium]MDD3227554.1 Asp-tRNA(Asn)/Glu-tRNA(Gln) amidotransferase subunit GatC [Tissierellia bacterium]MDD3751560.1 Asp-tRNA(Asn)/Glu-tRNA(Gln) amidotransferase subunit GatC [Tissierellia bacterium]MDD4678978.1 Asp-tRNA(Asn)/Glu-tRNA(Gln) amidotransferase subunit GatC [Tissierellia bacterium]
MIKKDEVLKIAKLAKLSVDENEIEQLIEDMSKIIEYADSINNVAETVDVEFDNINNIVNAFNEDIVLDSYDRDEILKNREGGENGYFVIRKSIRG